MQPEFDHTFMSLSDWTKWYENHREIFDKHAIDERGQKIIDTGFIEPLTQRRVIPTEIVHTGDNWREGLLFNGINSRMRAVMRLIETSFDMASPFGIRIYAPEAITALALRLRGIFPRFLGSEFTLEPELRQQLYPIPFEDFTALSLPSDTFDLVTSNEVLEHVPDLDLALRETWRILKPGGWHIGTCPFNFLSEASQRKAKLENGEIIHLTEPEYHGNPMSPSGSLVFEIPGWDILRRSKNAGFRFYSMRFMGSQTYGYLSNDITGIFVLTCRK